MWPRDAYVGQRVVRVGGKNSNEQSTRVKLGTVYTVLWVGVFDETIMIDLVEVPDIEQRNYARGYVANFFRPVDESRLDVFREMLKRPGVWSRDENCKDVVRADAL